MNYDDQDPLKILKLRLARGEINIGEYNELKKISIEENVEKNQKNLYFYKLIVLINNNKNY